MKEKCWYQGKYNVRNKQKYMGTAVPVYRSSFEKRFFWWLDNNDKVIKWGSEILTIQYVFDVDGKTHTYIPDVYAEIVNNDGKTIKYLIEVKPEKEAFPPKPPKNGNVKARKRYLMEAETFIKNQNKWAYADAWCNKKGITFTVVTEKDLFA